MPFCEAPCVELGSAPRSPSGAQSPTPSDISSTSSPEPQNIRPTPLFRVLAMPPPEPVQPPGQEELERRLPGYRRIVIPRELTLIELLKQCSGATTDDEVLRIREAKLRVVAEKIGLRRLHVLAPRLRSLELDGSALSSLRDLGIGLVHLKILSVNRCGLTSLDGVWGLSSLRELHASGNRLQDLGPLAALQKLHTLNLADNPIADISRLWTLAVCGSLRRLTLKGTPASDEPNYRAGVASSLPMLVSLDDRPINSDLEEEMDDLFSSSDSEAEVEVEAGPEHPVPLVHKPSVDEEPGPSTSREDIDKFEDDQMEKLEALKGSGKKLHLRRRPATTEGVGARPRYELPPRPRTAQPPRVDAPARLQILNTLMDEEWRSSGSRLTSHDAVCGNLAQALRRPASSRRRFPEREPHRALIETGVDLVERVLAEEIPRVPKMDDWMKFKEVTGIDIDIDFSRRPEVGDPLSAIERLERIERETRDRLSNPEGTLSQFDVETSFNVAIRDYNAWKFNDLTRDLTSADLLLDDAATRRNPEDLPD